MAVKGHTVWPATKEKSGERCQFLSVKSVLGIVCQLGMLQPLTG